MSVSALLVTNTIARVDYESTLLIDNKEVEKTTIYLYDKIKNVYVQLYYNGNEFVKYAEYKCLPDMTLKLEFTAHIYHELVS